MRLNHEQAQCVDEDGHCLVVACPGSGKTRVITRKIAALLKRHPDSRICAVTFTRDAAGELSERVTQEIGKARFNQACRIGTFHSLAIRQLRNARLLGALASPAQQYALISRAMQLSRFEGAMDEAVQTVEAAKTALTEHPAQENPLYLAYAELLSRQKLVDLFDVLRNAVQFMRDGTIQPYAVDFMLVDEFQDTDNVQMAWILEHAKAGAKITCVGDDDQSIYSWRGALGNAGMLDFKQKCGATLITLGENYRSHQEILSLADQIIRADTLRIPKELRAASGPGGAIERHRVGSVFHEAEVACNTISNDTIPLPASSSVFERTVPEGSWAVLSRNRRYLDTIEAELQLRKIRFRRSSSESIWNRAPFLQMVALLRSLQLGSPDGLDSALHHAISKKLGVQSANLVMDKLHQIYGDAFPHLLDGSVNPELKTSLVADEFDAVSRFATLSAGWRTGLAKGKFRRVITGVAEWLATLESDPVKGDLVIRMGDFLSGLDGSMLTRVNAVAQLNSKEGEGDRDGVVLTTMHAAKGLEFDKVWVIGCNEGIVPSAKSGNLPEERRLLYVAVTRAKKTLHLSATTEAKPSSLLTEVGINFDVVPS